MERLLLKPPPQRGLLAKVREAEGWAQEPLDVRRASVAASAVVSLYKKLGM